MIFSGRRQDKAVICSFIFFTTWRWSFFNFYHWFACGIGRMGIESLIERSKLEHFICSWIKLFYTWVMVTACIHRSVIWNCAILSMLLVIQTFSKVLSRVFRLHLLQLFEWVMCRSNQLSPILSSIVECDSSICVLASIELHIACSTLIVNTLQMLARYCQMNIVAIEVMCRLCLYFVVWTCTWWAE